MNQDPTEQEDVSKRFPERVAILKKLWEDWAEKNKVLPLQAGGAKPRLERLRSRPH
ncbi:MAG: hypothetical protein HOL92_10620 [Opitutales bacterium]|nr:hypothetical protein [Opitutales bacterium]